MATEKPAAMSRRADELLAWFRGSDGRWCLATDHARSPSERQLRSILDVYEGRRPACKNLICGAERFHGIVAPPQAAAGGDREDK